MTNNALANYIKKFKISDNKFTNILIKYKGITITTIDKQLLPNIGTNRGTAQLIN